MLFILKVSALLLWLKVFQSYKLIYGLTCFNCPEISHPRFCNHVKTCDTGQICSMKNTVDTYGDKVFHLGCMDSNLCDRNPTEHTSKCYSCCGSDLCNSNGCGDIDSRGRNGTICYECDAQLQSEFCHKISFCDFDEMCYVSEEERFGETFYRSGCKDKNLCHILEYPYPVIGKRNKMRSTKFVTCCDRNLCNNAANGPIHSTQGPIHATVAANGPIHSTLSPSMLTSTDANVCLWKSPCFNNATCKVNPVNGNSFECVCQDGYFGLSCELTDSKGINFLLLFTEGNILQYATPKALITTQQNEQMSAYYFSNHLNQSLNVVKNQNEYSLNHDVYMTDGLNNAGVEVNSNIRTMVYGMSYNSYGYKGYDGFSGGYMAIPSNMLARNYIIPSFTTFFNISLCASMIAITTKESNTTLNINLKMTSGLVTYKNKTFLQNDNLTVVLNRYETFEISHTSDLTGTLITSTRPVAVVSGNKCNYIVFMHACNTFIEMVLPVEQLDTTYIVPHIATRSNSTVRVISVHDGSITVELDNQVTTKQQRKREFTDFHHNTIFFINASSSVYAMIYPHETKDIAGDAFMMTIYGINQYLSEYNFVVPSGFTSFISVTVKTSEVSGFILDGQLVATDTIYTINGGYGSYSSFAKQIASGEHHLKHSKDVKFGLWIYGSAFHDAYGFPAGIAFRTI